MLGEKEGNRREEKTFVERRAEQRKKGSHCVKKRGKGKSNGEMR